MKRFSCSFRRRGLLCLIVGAVIGAPMAPVSSQPTPIIELDRIAAIVNDDVIVWSELEGRLEIVLAQLRQSTTPLPSLDELRRQVLERLILHRLQLRLAHDAGVRVDDNMLNLALNRLAEQNELTLRQFRDILERDGYEFAKFREEIRDEIMITELRKRQVENQVHISQRDIDHYLSTIANQGTTADLYRIGHILIAIPDGASSDEITRAQARAERILDELQAGAAFANLAAAYSDGQHALAGGDLGWRKVFDLPTILGDVVPPLEIGEAAGPIRSTSGFHLIKLTDKRSDDQHMVEQTHVRHILIALNEITDEETARRRLSILYERIFNGADFGELARTHSNDPSSAAKGGDLGWVNPGQMVPEFEQAMDALEPGEVSEPFESPYGWHLVQVLERREFDDTETARRTEALRKLRSRKIEERVESWLRRIREEAYVEYRLPAQVQAE